MGRMGEWAKVRRGDTEKRGHGEGESGRMGAWVTGHLDRANRIRYKNPVDPVNPVRKFFDPGFWI